MINLLCIVELFEVVLPQHDDGLQLFGIVVTYALGKLMRGIQRAGQSRPDTVSGYQRSNALDQSIGHSSMCI